MKYLLILAIYNGGVTTVPQVYSDESTCVVAGKRFVSDTNEQQGASVASYYCAVKYDEK